MWLDGPDVLIFVQEVAVVGHSQDRHSVTFFFKMQTDGVWGLSSTSRYLTNHAVLPTKVVGLGCNTQPHSSACNKCCLSITLHYGSASRKDWTLWQKARGEFIENTSAHV